jgi:hypothetical protein
VVEEQEALIQQLVLLVLPILEAVGAAQVKQQMQVGMAVQALL